MLTYTANLSLPIWKTNIRAKKIDELKLVTYEMVIARFSIQDKLKRIWFLEKTFLVADISMESILKISFLSLKDVDIRFAEINKLT